MPKKVMKHSYPQDLVSVVRNQWSTAAFPMGGEILDSIYDSNPLPDSSILEFVLSACYQASLLKNEGRPVTFRLLFREPSRLNAHEGPPAGLHRIVFSEPRPFDENELRHLSCGADFYRSLIGVDLDHTESLRIWGLINSGSRWIQAVHGGRKSSEFLPPCLVVRVTGPGRLAVCRGSITIATLNSGQVACPATDSSLPQWLPARFMPGNNFLELHRRGLYVEEKHRARLGEELIKALIQQVYRRIVSIMRNFHHGGTLVLIPEEKAKELASKNRKIDIKYIFVDEEPRRRLASLYLQLMNTLAEDGARQGILSRPMEWSDYVSSDNMAIEHLDEAIFEAAHFIADLTTLDGAVIMTKSLELVGFGAEILGGPNRIQTVAKVLDAEGEKMQVESAQSVGTRHRSAYRLCHELRDAVAIVVSQDGMVRVVTWKDDTVVYWDQAAVSVLDL